MMVDDRMSPQNFALCQSIFWRCEMIKKGSVNFIFSVLLINSAMTCQAIAAEKAGKNPQDKADVVGRDLNVAGLGAIGHVGLWTGDKVIEALNQSPVIIQSTLQDFKSRSAYWGAVYYQYWNIPPAVVLPSQARMPYTYTSYSAKEAAVHRAILIQQIGAEYTIFPTIKKAIVEICNGQHCTEPIVGKYRCDTFVKDTYTTAGVGFSYGAFDTPSSMWSDFIAQR